VTLLPIAGVGTTNLGHSLLFLLLDVGGRVFCRSGKAFLLGLLGMPCLIGLLRLHVIISHIALVCLGGHVHAVSPIYGLLPGNYLL